MNKMKLRGNQNVLSGRLAVVGAAILGLGMSEAAFVIAESPGIFTPSFRGSEWSTYVAWDYGSWDGNDDTTGVDTLNPTPSINPDGLSGVSLVQNNSVDIISGSNNVYTSVSQLNLTLTLVTNGVVGSSGFTTIIIQGSGLSAVPFNFGGALDGFGFGAIGGVDPEYVIARNADGEGQWWAKWVVPGNAASYEVAVFGQLGSGTGSVLTVTDMSIDTWYSPDGGSTDTVVVPEPGVAMLGSLALLAGLRRRRKIS